MPPIDPLQPTDPRDRPDVPRSPTGRVPQWVLDEATGRTVGDTGWRTPPTGRVRRRRRWPLVAGAGAAALLVAVGSGVLGDVTSTGGPAPGTTAVVPPARDGQDAPLGTPAPVAVRSDRWKPLHTDAAGQPVRWDPCRPVHFVVNPAGMPDGGRAVFDAALARVSEVTGLQFVDDGETDETERTSPVERVWTGALWAPVLVRWDLPAEHAEQPGGRASVLGRGGPMTVTASNGQLVNVSGTLGLTVDAASLDPSEPAEAEFMKAVWLHEWAHVVGLDHVEDPGQLMNPSTTWVTDYAAGDLTGLAALGTGPCLGT